jgi:hypothetical protein
LQAICDPSAANACAAMALFELARTQSLGGRFEESAATFLRLAGERPSDPLAPNAIDIAMVIREELYRAAPDALRADALSAALAIATRHFPTHPQRDHWRLIEVELAALRGDADGALRAADALPRTDARWGEARLWVAGAALDPRAALTDADRVTRADRELAALADRPDAVLGPVFAVRRALIAARRDGLAGESAKAQSAADAIASDRANPMEIRLAALAIRLDIDERSGRELTLPSTLLEEIRRDASAWWPAVRERVRAAISSTDEAFCTRQLRSLIVPFVEIAASERNAEGRIALAEALLRAGQPTLVDRAFREGEERQVPAMLVRAEGLRRQGTAASLDAAMGLFRAVSAAVPERSLEWWRAELGQLRVAAAPGTGDAAVAVRARIHWLRGIDHTLGGPLTGPAIEELLRSLPDR